MGDSPSRLGGLGSVVSSPAGSTHFRAFEIKFGLFRQYISDYSLSDYLFCTVYIKEFLRPNGDGLNL